MISVSIGESSAISLTFVLWSHFCNVGRIGVANPYLDILNRTPIHLVESVENWRRGMRRCLARSSYANVFYTANSLLRTRFSMTSRAKHWIMRNCNLPSLQLSWSGYKFYWLDEVNRSTIKRPWRERVWRPGFGARSSSTRGGEVPRSDKPVGFTGASLNSSNANNQHAIPYVKLLQHPQVGLS